MKKMNEIDKNKLEKMWSKILDYEKDRGMSESDKASTSTILKIIDEVYKECL